MRDKHDSSPEPRTPGGSNLNDIPDDDAPKVVPNDVRETTAREPGSKPFPDELDRPDPSGTRPTPL